MPYYFLWGIGVDMADDDGGRLADESFSPTDDTDFVDWSCYADSSDDTDDTDLVDWSCYASDQIWELPMAAYM